MDARRRAPKRRIKVAVFRMSKGRCRHGALSLHRGREPGL